MARWIVAGLVLLNLVLGAALWNRAGGEKTAYGQIGVPNSDVVTIGGFNTVYLLQVSTGYLVAMQVDPANKKVNIVAAKDLKNDLERIR